MNTYRFINATEYTKMIEDIIDSIDNTQVQKHIELFKKYFIETLVKSSESPYTGPRDLHRWIRLTIENELIVITSDDPQYKNIRNGYENEVYDIHCCSYNKETYLVVATYDNCFLLLHY